MVACKGAIIVLERQALAVRQVIATERQVLAGSDGGWTPSPYSPPRWAASPVATSAASAQLHRHPTRRNLPY